MTTLPTAPETWLRFLQENGFSCDEGKAPIAPNLAPDAAANMYDLSHLGVLHCEGEEAGAFLQGQLSNDIQLLTESGATQLTSYCTPKGRMLALFRVLKTPTGFALIAPNEVIAAVKPRLQMFVMRAKVVFSQLDAEVLLGLKLLPGDEDQLATLCAAHNIQSCKITQQPERFILRGAAEDMVSLSQALQSQHKLEIVDYRHWVSADIEQGLPQVYGALSEALIPQSLNLDLVGGVNFKKGCYPGQEIIARVKYRGKPKTRMIGVHAASDVELALGAPVFVEGRNQSAGMVVAIGADHAGKTPLQITVPVMALEQGNVSLHDHGSAPLERMALPYPIPVF